MSDVESDGPGSSSAAASGSKLTAAKRGKTKSALWAHFDELGREKASCKTCGTSIARSRGSTSSMQNHLKLKHTKLYSLLLQEERSRSKVPDKRGHQLSVGDLFQAKSMFSSSHPKQVEFDKALLDFIIEDMRPFNIVQGEGFRKLIHVANSKLTVKHCTTVASWLPRRLEEVKKHVQERLDRDKEDMVSATFSTDIWTSRANEGYISLTLHYINKAFHLQVWNQECASFTECHTADNIQEKLDAMTRDMELPTSCDIFAVHDNGTNFIKAVQDSDMLANGLRCVCHTL